MPSEEEIQKWREENKDKLNPGHEFVVGPGGSVMEKDEVTQEELDALKERNKGASQI